jgi:cell fate regulator YaaT (PSP1 superfamily)
MAQGETTKPKSQKHKKTMLIRYGRMAYLGWFEHNESRIPKTTKRAVVKTDRGLELGEIVGTFNYRAGQFKSTKEQVEHYFANRTKDYPLGAGGSFVRFATKEDLMEEKHLEISAKEEQKCCEAFVKEMDLPMKIVDTEHLFGGERIIIYFTSNGRVDFRELVRRLAREYQTRIELRQIGSRDEAKLVSDYESCGQECCCRRFLKILEPVNMRMAKLQKATLDPSKISGHCGRLKCCLRYEDDTYKDLKQKLPKKKTVVMTPQGEGTVADSQILTQLVEVLYESGEKKAWPLEEIEIIGKGLTESDTEGVEEYESVEEDEGIEEDQSLEEDEMDLEEFEIPDNPVKQAEVSQEPQESREDKNRDSENQLSQQQTTDDHNAQEARQSRKKRRRTRKNRAGKKNNDNNRRPDAGKGKNSQAGNQ